MNHACNEYTLKALGMAKGLMDLANEGEVRIDDTGCCILFGVMRDCAYRILRQAERGLQAQKAKENPESHLSEIQQDRIFDFRID